MLNRTVVINPIEPSLLSIRSPLGIALELGIKFLGQDGEAVNPDTLQPQIAFLPRSSYGVLPYDMVTTSGEDGLANVTVPGNALIDVRGYNIELYQRRTADNPVNPPVPTGMLAKGTLRLEGSAYQQYGPLGMINVPTIVGPPGPQGVQGPTGERGSMWWTGNGPPDTTVGSAGKIVGDMYLDNGLPPGAAGTGDVWRFDGEGWVLGTF